jgi:hypothetical protein
LFAAQVSAEEVNVINNPPPEALVTGTVYEAPSQPPQQQQYGQQQQQYGQQQQNAAVAAGLPPLVPGVPGKPEYSDDAVEQRWIDLFNNPGNYFDNRTTVRAMCCVMCAALRACAWYMGYRRQLQRLAVRSWRAVLCVFAVQQCGCCCLLRAWQDFTRADRLCVPCLSGAVCTRIAAAFIAAEISMTCKYTAPYLPPYASVVFLLRSLLLTQ